MGNMNADSRHDILVSGPVKDLEFQVSSVLNRLEEAVEKFDSKGTINDLEVEQTLHFIPKSPQEIINIIQDAIVNLNVSKDDDEPNLAILPALRDVDKLALVSHSIKYYVLCLDVVHSDYLINWVKSETSKWLAQMFGFVDCCVFYDENYLEGYVKLVRFLLLRMYPTYNQDGFEAFKQNFPVIYYNTPAMFVAAQYICCRIGLPLRFVQEVPLLTSEPNEYAEQFIKIIDENRSKNQTPLLFLANAETAIQPSKCYTSKLKSLCNDQKIWLHLSGSSIAVLPLLQRKGEVQLINFFDSITVMFGEWLNIPALPSAILFKGTSEDQELITAIDIDRKCSVVLPLWTSIKCLGQEQILNDFMQKFDSCQKLYQKLEQYPCLKIISKPPGDQSPHSSIADIIAKIDVQNDVFEQVISSVAFKFFPENNKLWSLSYCDKLNSWLSQVLHRELPVVPINIIELDEHGLCLRYSPFSNTPLIPESDWTAFYISLDQQLDILKSTVAQKETLYNLIQHSNSLKLVELPDWAGLGGVCYIPQSWDTEDPHILMELNRLNYQIVQQLRNTDSAFSIGESVDGFSCIRFGMVGLDSDVMDLINLVETVGKQEEESWNYIDTMAEVVKKGIETATQDLQKESEEKLWQEGILRHVPVFGSFVNWWSPLNKENGGGIKGRSLDLTAGVIESTEKIYRYHMQGTAKTSDVKPIPQYDVQTPITTEKESNVQVSNDA